MSANIKLPKHRKQKFCQLDDIRKLEPGTILQNIVSGNAYQVLEVDKKNGTAIGIRTVEISNPCEWQVLLNPPRYSQSKKRKHHVRKN